MEDDVDLGPANKFIGNFVRRIPQKTKAFEALELTLGHVYDYWDPVLANMVQASAMLYILSNNIEKLPNCGRSRPTPGGAGQSYAKVFRLWTGVGLAYAAFVFPKDLYPDFQQCIEVLPDIEIIVNYVNDILS